MRIKLIMLAAMFAGSLTAYAQSGKNFVDNEHINVELLSGFEWSVRGASDAQGHSLADFSKNPNVQLQFKDGLLAVSGGCNNFSTSYQLDSQNSNISLGRVASTKMACVPELMAQDQAIKKVIDNNKLDLGLITKENGELYLKMENQQGDHLLVVAGSFFGLHKYNQPDTVFLEISNETSPCNSIQGKESCPLVRKITYDDQGNKIKKGQWHTLWRDDIEGWEFNPRERQVLRLKIYRPGPTSWRTFSSIKLDQVIEREIVK